MAPRKSKKLQAKELAAQLQEKRAEFESLCIQEEKFWVEYGFDKRFPFDRDECVERKLKEWKQTLRRVPTGKYQDPAQVRAEYQQKFIWQIQQLAPHVLEELRNLVPLFQDFFGSHGDKYNTIFNRYKEEFLHLDERFTGVVSAALDSRYLSFRSDRREFRVDFLWGEYETLLRILLFLYARDPQSTEERKREALRSLRSGIAVNWYLIPDNFDHAIVNNYSEDQAVLALSQLIDPAFDPFFLETSETQIKQFFAEIFGEESPHIRSFLDLQVSLLTWCHQYALEKDWILRYAYYFLLTFSSDPKIKVAEMDIPYLQIWSLMAQPFEFKFESWLIWKERKEDYEKRLRNEFETELTNHFHNVSVGLRLDEQKRRTKPPDFARLKWLVYATAFGLSKPEQILNRLANESESGSTPDLSTIYRAFDEFSNFDLPVPH